MSELFAIYAIVTIAIFLKAAICTLFCMRNYVDFQRKSDRRDVLKAVACVFGAPLWPIAVVVGVVCGFSWLSSTLVEIVREEIKEFGGD